MSTTYERIKEICAERGITINKMCNEIGISYGIMSNLKAGKTKSLSAETLAKIANYFNVLADTLLGDIKSPTSEEIGPVRRALLEEIKDYSEEEAALLLARARKIKDSR